MNINPSMTVIDYCRLYGRMPVYRRIAARVSANDKPASAQDARNSRRMAEYAQRANGQKAPLIQLWRAP